MFLLSKFAIKKRTGWVTGDATHGQSSLIPELGIVDINMSAQFFSITKKNFQTTAQSDFH